MLKLALILIGTLFCLVLGAFTAVAPGLSARFAVVIMLGLVLVVAAIQRDSGDLSVKQRMRFITLMLLITSFWPSFVVLRIPGLPTLDPRRLLAVLTLGLVIYMLISRAVVRKRLAGARGLALFVVLVLGLMTVLRFLTALRAPYPVFGLPVAFWELAGYSSTALVAFLLLHGEATLDRLTKLAMWSIALCALVAVAEVATQRTLVVDVFGRFANVDGGTAAALALSRFRDGVLRAQGPFEHSLPLAEFACVAFSFAGAGLLWSRSDAPQRRGILWIGVFSSVAAIGLSGARSGLVCLFVAVAWLTVVKLLCARGGASLKGFDAALRLGLVAALLVSVAAGLAPFAKEIVQGRTQAQSESSASRALMLKRGIAAMTDAPVLGHGVGTAMDLAGIKGSGGVPTLDNYLVLIAVESGVPYMALMISLFLIPAVWAAHQVLTGASVPSAFLMGASAALLTLLAMRSILAINYNLPLAYLLVGLVLQFAGRPGAGRHQEKVTV